MAQCPDTEATHPAAAAATVTAAGASPASHDTLPHAQHLAQSGGQWGSVGARRGLFTALYWSLRHHTASSSGLVGTRASGRHQGSRLDARARCAGSPAFHGQRVASFSAARETSALGPSAATAAAAAAAAASTT